MSKKTLSPLLTAIVLVGAAVSATRNAQAVDFTLDEDTCEDDFGGTWTPNNTAGGTRSECEVINFLLGAGDTLTVPANVDLLLSGTSFSQGNMTCDVGSVLGISDSFTSAGTLSNSGDASIGVGAVMTSNGPLTQAGTLTVRGTLNNAADLYNLPDATLTNSLSGVLFNEGIAKLTNAGTVANSGDLTNEAEFTNRAGASLTNGGVVSNNGAQAMLRNEGSVWNLGTDATLENLNDAALVNLAFIGNTEGATLENLAAFDHLAQGAKLDNVAATFINGDGGTFFSEGTVSSTDAATITNVGAFEMVSVALLENFGSTFTNRSGAHLESDGVIENHNSGALFINEPGAVVSGSGSIDNGNSAYFRNQGDLVHLEFKNVKSAVLVHSGVRFLSATLTNLLGDVFNQLNATMHCGVIHNRGDFSNNGTLLGARFRNLCNETLWNTGTVLQPIDNYQGVINNTGTLALPPVNHPRCL